MGNKAIIRGGVDILFGETKPISTPAVEEDGSLLETVQDEELKDKLRKRQLDGRGRPKKGRPHDSKTEGYATICVKANREKWAKLEYISLQETLQKKEVLDLALDMLIEKYEKEKGAICLKTPTKKGNVFNK